MHLASTRPDQVLTLNLIDASGAPRPESRSLDSLDTNSNQRPWIIRAAQHPVFSKLLLKCTPKFLFAMNIAEIYGDQQKFTQETVDRYYELMLREGNRKATLDRLSQARTHTFDFGRMTMPTLILWGEEDRWIPVSQGVLLEKAIPGAKLLTFPGVGHVPMEEIPTESVAEYLSFLGVEVRKNYLQPPKLIVYTD